MRRLRRGSRPRDRVTDLLGIVALGGGAGVVGTEIARVWRHGSAPLPKETPDVLGAAEEAARQTLEVAVAGYRTGSARENALFNLLTSFMGTWLFARVSTHTIRRRGRLGPFRPLKVGRRHIHHFVPGIALAFVAGGISVVSRNEQLDALLAVPFGAGVALTLDESALLLELEDVYWTERGVVSVQISLVTLLMLSAVVVTLRVLRRGEVEVLPGLANATSL
jgi:hypothetical protein